MRMSTVLFIGAAGEFILSVCPPFTPWNIACAFFSGAALIAGITHRMNED